MLVLDLYVLALASAPALCWKLVGHKQWSWFGIKLVEWALIIALGSMADYFNFDYYGWRDSLRQPDKITPDRDEAQPARKAIDNRS